MYDPHLVATLADRIELFAPDLSKLLKSYTLTESNLNHAYAYLEELGRPDLADQALIITAAATTRPSETSYPQGIEDAALPIWKRIMRDHAQEIANHGHKVGGRNKSARNAAEWDKALKLFRKECGTKCVAPYDLRGAKKTLNNLTKELRALVEDTSKKVDAVLTKMTTTLTRNDFSKRITDEKFDKVEKMPTGWRVRTKQKWTISRKFSPRSAFITLRNEFSLAKPTGVDGRYSISSFAYVDITVKEREIGISTVYSFTDRQAKLLVNNMAGNSTVIEKNLRSAFRSWFKTGAFA